MCPFLVQKSDNALPTRTQFLVITASVWCNEFIEFVWNYAQNMGKTQSVLLFDGSLGLGDLDSNNTPSHTNNVDFVLQGHAALSTLIQKHNAIDLLSGRSKTINLGIYSEPQLYGVATDLKILGNNYQTVLIYVPPTLTRVQRFFCQRFDSICFANATQNCVEKALKLLQKYPKMKCYLDAKKTGNDVLQALQIGLIHQKNRILYKNME